MRLVEIVQVDDQLTLGRGIEAEISEMRVAADNWIDARSWKSRNIIGHHDGCAAQKTVRRGDHPPDPNGDQPVQPALV
jgi:hypothetical protein